MYPTWGISSKLLIDSAAERGLSWEIIDRHKNTFFIHSPQLRDPIIFKSTSGTCNSVVGSRIADDKMLTYATIARLVPALRQPKSIVVYPDNVDTDLLLAAQLHFPVVVKPIDGAHGESVYVNIATTRELTEALQKVFAYHNNNQALIQEMLQGNDYRILVVGYTMIAAAQRIPAHVIGDGERSVEELVVAENKHPMRGANHQTPLSTIEITEDSIALLAEQGLLRTDVPSSKQHVYLKRVSNLSMGGVSVDVTDSVHASIRVACEQLAKVLRMGVLAIDIVATDIAQPLTTVHGGVVEINSTPGIRMHHFPYQGKSIDVAGAIIDFAINEAQHFQRLSS
jgi:cyanophycin synthetase